MAETAHTATTEVPSEGHGGFPPFDSHTFGSQLFWLALTFVVLYVLMSRIALPRVERVLKTRHDTIEGDLAQAQRLRDESNAAGAAYEKALSDARANAQAIAQKTRDEVAAKTDARRKALEADLATKLAASEETIRARKAQAMASVKDIAADATIAIVERLTGKAPDRARAESAVANAGRNQA